MSRHPSIRRRLLVMLISTILLVWLAVVLLVYIAAEHEVEEIFDADLARSARILHSLLQHEVEEEQEMALKARDVIAELGAGGIAAYPGLAGILDEYVTLDGKEQLELAGTSLDADLRGGSGGLAFIARYADGTVMMRDHSAPEIPVAADGFADMRLGDESWRIYSLRDPHNGFIVQVGEKQGFRAGLVRYITRNTLMPILLALPVLGILVWVVVGHALAPLRRVTQEVSMRAPDALEPIDDTRTPPEIHGLLRALNTLFERVAATLRHERQFTADAAHELRTPLAALKTHLQVAQAGTAETRTRQSLTQALDGVDRATHSVEQLLLLARADADQERALVGADTDLRDVAVSVVSALSQQAVERDIDLGLDAPGSVCARGDASALQMLLKNLVDNAVRYTPVGGTVTVAVGSDRDGSWLEVADDGPGVALDERTRIFSRFHRGAGEQAAGTNGSGLGLSIVRRIADLHGASIDLGAGLGGRGLGVKVTFPPG